MTTASPSRAAPTSDADREEIAELSRYFLHDFHRSAGHAIPQPLLTTAALQLLARYDWPGNVRELRNCLEVAQLIAGGGTVDETHLKKQIRVSPSSLRICSTTSAPWAGGLE